MMVVSNENKISWKKYEKLWNRFSIDRNSLPEADTISSLPVLVDKGVARESVNAMKNEKSSGPSCLVSELVKLEKEEAGLSLITISDYSGRSYFSRIV